MKNVLLVTMLLSLVGCTKEKRYVGIVHDYMFTAATRQCESHGGLHYVTNDIKMKVDEKEAYPCSETVKFRCQDGTLLTFETGLGYCFIPKAQLEENGVDL